MKREIKFRGKRLDNGDWVYGYLVVINERSYIFNDDVRKNVDPATVAQYTGLKDKNGKEIYEGDILDVNFLSHKTKVKYVMDSFMACCKNYPNEYLYHVCSECQVIGNLHDNLELMQEDEE